MALATSGEPEHDSFVAEAVLRFESCASDVGSVVLADITISRKQSGKRQQEVSSLHHRELPIRRLARNLQDDGRLLITRWLALIVSNYGSEGSKIDGTWMNAKG